LRSPPTATAGRALGVWGSQPQSAVHRPVARVTLHSAPPRPDGERSSCGGVAPVRRAQLPPTLLAVAAGQGGVVSVAQARDHGLSDKDVAGLVGRGTVVRGTRGAYDVGAVPLAGRSWDERRLRAAWVGLLAFGDDAVAVGPCALVLHGVRGLPVTVRPEAAVPRGRNRRDRDGIALRQFDAGMTTTELAGRRVATLDWALAQAVPELPRGHALAVLDSALHQGLADADGLRRAHEHARGRLAQAGPGLPRGHALAWPASALHQGLADADGLRRAHEHARGRRGVARRHVVWGLADARAESPLESFARLDCVDEGVPPHTLQLPVHDHGGRVVARGDMAWRYRDGRWLVAELGGRDVHDTPDAVFADRARQDRLVATGRIDVLRFTGRDVGTIGRTVRAALHR